MKDSPPPRAHSPEANSDESPPNSVAQPVVAPAPDARRPRHMSHVVERWLNVTHGKSVSGSVNARGRNRQDTPRPQRGAARVHEKHLVRNM